MKIANLFLLLVFFFLYVPLSVQAQVPSLISYQGSLTDNSGDPVSDGVYGMNFKLYTAEQSGSAIWEEGQSVTVVNGIFNVLLGSVEEFNISFDKPYWLGISVEGGSEMSPRIQLSSSPYSMKAKSVEDGAITSDKISQMNAQPGQVLTWTDNSWQPQEGEPGPEGPQGPQGPEGPQGSRGPSGISNYNIVSANYGMIQAGFPADLAVQCPSGQKVLAGGHSVGNSNVIVTASAPASDERRWLVNVWNTGNSQAGFSAYAICANVSN